MATPRSVASDFFVFSKKKIFLSFCLEKQQLDKIPATVRLANADWDF